MHNTMSSFLNVLGGALLAAFSMLHPYAATGAIFGCLFFIIMQPETTKLRKLVLTIVSWGAGYSAGVWMYGEGPPWSQKAMAISFIAACLFVAALTSVLQLIQTGGQIPPWIQAVLDKFPQFPKKGDN